MQIKIPDIGDFDAVEVIEVLVAQGDTVSQEQGLIVLESDKATMEVPSPAAGTVSALSVKVGDKVGEGDVIGELDTSGGEQKGEPAAKAKDRGKEPAAEAKDSGKEEPETGAKERDKEEPAAETKDGGRETEAAPQEAAVGATSVANSPAPDSRLTSPPQPESAPQPQRDADSSGPLPHASPAVRRFARELGVDLTRVDGSGPKGRILKEDVQGYVKQSLSGAGGTAAAAGGSLPQQPAVDFSKFGEIETRPLARIRKLSAANLHRNWLLVPHVTQFETADITELEAFRKRESGEVKLTLLPFVLKAVAIGLRTYPEFNSSLAPDGASLILKKYCHLGFAADTPNGLVVPVIRDVWGKTVSELAAEAAELAATARDGKLGPAQMQGGCFSISSLGGIGGSHFTPIVNAPEVAILGVSRARTEAVWDGSSFQPRLLLPLSLSYDHRVIDGAAAARFAVFIASLLSDVRRLCL